MAPHGRKCTGQKIDPGSPAGWAPLTWKRAETLDRGHRQKRTEAVPCGDTHFKTVKELDTTSNKTWLAKMHKKNRIDDL
jgi:hypothetical protein